MSSKSDFSLWDLQRSLSSFQSITRSTESYAFCKSMSRLNLRFFSPCTSFSSRLAWMAVDLPSLKPVWYTFDEITCGQVDLILSRIAFSMILDKCDLTTMGLISSRLQGPFVKVFCSGTKRPIRRYSGIWALLSESAISYMTFSPSYSFFERALPSKQSGPSPLLKFDCLVASLMSSTLKVAVVSIYSSAISSFWVLLSSRCCCMWSGLL